MKKYRVIITQEALKDVLVIAEYIEEKFGEERANLFLYEIEIQMDNLGNSGVFFRKTSFVYRNYSIYQKPFPPSNIFYIVKESVGEVHILRVLREERDVEALFRRVK